MSGWIKIEAAAQNPAIHYLLTDGTDLWIGSWNPHGNYWNRSHRTWSWIMEHQPTHYQDLPALPVAS